MSVQMSARMRPTITEFMQNPHNAGTTIPGGVPNHRKLLESRFMQFKAKYPGSFALGRYKLRNSTRADYRWFFLFRFPSTGNPDKPPEKLYHSLIELPSLPNVIADLNNLRFRFATSFPGWMFSQAWIFGQTGMIIPEFLELYKQALTDPPVKRNPSGLRMWDNSSYFPMVYLCKTSGLIYSPPDKFREIGSLQFLEQYLEPALVLNPVMQQQAIPE